MPKAAKKPEKSGTRPGSFEHMIAHSEKLWSGHVAPDGRPYVVSRSAIPPTREEMIKAAMTIPTIVCTKVHGVWQYSEPRYPTRAEMERQFPEEAVSKVA